jgi:hypothetical protein
MTTYNNPYQLIKISNINLHIGNGAKNELKKELKQFNFKFYHKIDTKKIKSCSAGFDNINEFINFIKSFEKKYYMYEYIFDNLKCVPYFDYEYEKNTQPSKIKLEKNLKKIIKLIKKVFNIIFNIEIKDEQIKITSSHGLKGSGKYKISYHIIIIGYYFEYNAECAHICHKLKEFYKNFDSCVYSKDRMMRCGGSSKNWEDQRVLIPINEEFELNQLNDYLITNIKNDYIKLKCPIKIKKKIIKNKYIKKYVEKIIDTNEIGNKIEEILKNEFHEDTYFTKSI